MKYKKSVFQALALITQLGISMLAPILLCVLGGSWLDEHLGWHSFLPLMLLGIAAGVRNCWMIVRHMNKEDKE